MLFFCVVCCVMRISASVTGNLKILPVVHTYEVQRGRPLLLICKSNDKNVGIWTRNNTEIYPSNENGLQIIRIDESFQPGCKYSVLWKKEALVFDTGMYACRSDDGKEEYYIRVKVQDKLTRPDEFPLSEDVLAVCTVLEKLAKLEETSSNADNKIRILPVLSIVRRGCPITMLCMNKDKETMWEKDGTPFPAQTDIEFTTMKINVLPSGNCYNVLWKKNARMSDTGTYTCSSKDDADYYDAKVKVQARNLEIFPVATPYEVQRGQPLLLICKSNDKNVGTWTKDKTDIYPPEENGIRVIRIDVSRQFRCKYSVLWKKEAQVSDTGIYACRSSDGKEEYYVRVKVQDKLTIPEKTHWNEDVQAVLGEVTKLEETFSFSGANIRILPAMPRVQRGQPMTLFCTNNNRETMWEKDGTPFPAQSDNGFTTMTIKVLPSGNRYNVLWKKKVRLSDTGTYTCRSRYYTEYYDVNLKVQASSSHGIAYTMSLHSLWMIDVVFLVSVIIL